MNSNFEAMNLLEIWIDKRKKKKSWIKNSYINLFESMYKNGK